MATTKWIIDPTHSEIGFRVKHMMFTTISGNFKEFEAFAETENIFKNTEFEFSATVNSISTGNGERDAHLIGSDFHVFSCLFSDSYPRSRKILVGHHNP